MASAVGHGARRAATEPDTHGRNVQRSMENPGSPPYRRNGSLLLRDAPWATCKRARSNPAAMFYLPSLNLALQLLIGEAEQAVSVVVDRRGLGA